MPIEIYDYGVIRLSNTEREIHSETSFYRTMNFRSAYQDHID